MEETLKETFRERIREKQQKELEIIENPFVDVVKKLELVRDKQTLELRAQEAEISSLRNQIIIVNRVSYVILLVTIAYLFYCMWHVFRQSRAVEKATVL